MNDMLKDISSNSSPEEIASSNNELPSLDVTAKTMSELDYGSYNDSGRARQIESSDEISENELMQLRTDNREKFISILHENSESFSLTEIENWVVENIDDVYDFASRECSTNCVKVRIEFDFYPVRESNV